MRDLGRCKARRSGLRFPGLPPPGLDCLRVPAAGKDRNNALQPALVAQRIEHLTTDQKVGGSNPSERATPNRRGLTEVSGTPLVPRISQPAGFRVSCDSSRASDVWCPAVTADVNASAPSSSRSITRSSW